jgi:transposase
MIEPTLCCRRCDDYCQRCDLLVGLEGLHVVAVQCDDTSGAVTITVESEAGVMGCHACGVVAHGHGRIQVRLVDAPAMGRPVKIIWRKRRWVCPEPSCPVRSFVEQDDLIAAPRSKLTARACWWAIGQLRR